MSNTNTATATHTPSAKFTLAANLIGGGSIALIGVWLVAFASFAF